MGVEWYKGLSTGVDWQDKQHKELFSRINALLEAMSEGRGREEVKRLYTFLDEYFAVHFKAEEKAMARLNYPDELMHLKEHAHFIEDMARLKEEGGPQVGLALVIKTQRRVVDWLINHIAVSDKALGEFLLRSDKDQKKA
jgi:hemerythrin